MEFSWINFVKKATFEFDTQEQRVTKILFEGIHINVHVDYGFSDAHMNGQFESKEKTALMEFLLGNAYILRYLVTAYASGRNGTLFFTRVRQEELDTCSNDEVWAIIKE